MQKWVYGALVALLVLWMFIHSTKQEVASNLSLKYEPYKTCASLEQKMSDIAVWTQVRMEGRKTLLREL